MSQTVSEQGLLAAARNGNEQAFVRLTGPHRCALHVHCYRILGSLHDADDALQETMLRAWRGIDRFEPRAPLVAWLYRLATNACLRMLEQRGRQATPDLHLEPYPERLLEELPSAEPGPESLVEERESIGLAFVTAMQLLPPRQRVAVVLRDVLGWSAREVAELLGGSVPSVNSALQRGRERLERERREGTITRAHMPADGRTEAGLMLRFQEAWERVDIPGLVGLLAEDALLTMPPEAARIVGGASIGGFFGTVPLDGDLTRIRLLPARANGQPALAAYAQAEEGGPFTAYGVMVFAIQGDRIAGIVGFPDVTRPDLFDRLGLPGALAA